MAFTGFDAYSPKEIALRVQNAGVAKARLPALQTIMLGMLAGAFIGMGALYCTLVMSDATLGFAAARVAGGVCFSLGLLLVAVAGAELFTGNNLLAMAWAGRHIGTGELLRNWCIVALANLLGATALAAMVFLSGHWQMNDGAVGETYLRIARDKAALAPAEAFFRGALCNLFVCMAVWMAMAARGVADKFAAIVLPISAFVAAGFEHSVANMYYFPLALMIQSSAGPTLGVEAITAGAMFANLGIVIAGNLLGGSGLVALVYWLIYLKPARRS
jgi:formate transporter